MLKTNKNKIFSMKTLFIIIFSILMLNSSTKKIMANDLFLELDKLEVGQELPEYIKDQGIEIEDDNQETIYLKFESSSDFYPHFIETTNTNDILYIELKVPKELIDTYKDQLNQLGEPESVNATAPDGLKLISYPSKGIGFIFDEAQQLQSITKYPKKTVEQLIENEGENFKEISEQYSMPEELFEPNKEPDPIPKDVLYSQQLEKQKIEKTKNIITFVSSLSLIISVILIIIYFKNKKKKEIQSPIKQNLEKPVIRNNLPTNPPNLEL